MNSKPFINMCKKLDARYTPPSSQTIGNNLLDEREIVDLMQRHPLFETKNFKFVLVTDTATNMTKLKKLTDRQPANGWFKISHWIGCFANKLHLAITVAMENCKIAPMVEKMHKFTTKYSRNGTLRQALDGIAPKKIINAPSNRWYYQMFEAERFIEI
ncbi:MAG: hypothetical protein MHMPM18_002701 [Marteilia pararefringens]